MLGTIPSFWYQNELPKSFGSRDGILPKYGHGRGHFLIFCQFLKFSMPAKYLCFQVESALTNSMHTQFGPAPRID